MRLIHKEDAITYPANVTLALNGRRVTVTGPRGKLVRDFDHSRLSLTLDAEKRTLKAEMWHGKRKELCQIRTICSIINNMVTGVTQGYRYKMRFVYAHFPINVNISDAGKTVEIRNFLGEKIVRRVKMGAGVVCERSEAVKDEIILTGNDNEQVGQSAALIHQSVLVKNKDIRKFLDGIYVSEKGAIEN